MIDKLEHLRKLSSSLEPDSGTRNMLIKEVIDYTENFINSIPDLPAYKTTIDKGAGIYKYPIGENPGEIGSLLEIIKENVDTPGLNTTSGAHMAYIPGGGIFYSALGDYLADITNRYAGVFFASPGAVRLENFLIKWMADLIGYPATAGGNLTPGGSIANLTAVVTARDAMGIKSKDIPGSVIYVTEQAHHSIDKAIRIAGLRECIVRYIPIDEKFKMIPNLLEENIIADKKAGLKPWLVVASVGTTNTGAIDPIQEISAIAEKHNLWFHIDAAYGGFFILCDSCKEALKGLDKSDSIVMDPHKGLFLPYGSGALIVKDKMRLLESHYYEANYMQDALHADNEFAPADLSPELSKHFRGLRLWLPLKLLGTNPFKYALEEKVLLAKYFYEKLSEVKGFELGPYPELSVVTFRYIPKHGDVNEFNRILINEIQKEGKVFISSTMLNVKFTLRLAVLVYRTHVEHVDLVINTLKEKVKLLEAKLG